MMDYQTSKSSGFAEVLPPSRTGKKLASLEEFKLATDPDTTSTRPVKEYSLVVVTSDPGKVMLGMKNRGFGKGMYNSFGGKREQNESIEQCARRELEEETGILVADIQTMAHCRVGSMHFTFEDEDTEMLVHLFHVHVNFNTDNEDKENNNDGNSSLIPNTVNIDPDSIRGCEEITPEWFQYPDDIPLGNMFADDSLWLPPLLTAFFDKDKLGARLKMDGWFHFLPGGQQVNSIKHYYLDIRKPKQQLDQDNATATTMTTAQPTKTSFSLEKRLFHTLCCDKMHNTSVKEFKEAWAFCNAVRSVFGKSFPFDVIIDVAGGHGCVAGLLLILTTATRAVVIDPAQVGKDAVEKAWRTDFLKSKQLDYRHEDLRTGLPAELSQILSTTKPERVLVVACHACQHLSEEVLEIACCQFPGVHAAVMPCCQKDSSSSNNWKHASKNLNVKFEILMDLLLAGKVMSWQVGKPNHIDKNDDDRLAYSYDVRMKVIDAKITPQNRVIVAKSTNVQDVDSAGTSVGATKVEMAHQKLASVYARAHGKPRQEGKPNNRDNQDSKRNSLHQLSSYLSHSQSLGVVGLVLGFACGFWVANASRNGRK